MSKILNSSLLDGVSVIICCYNSEWIIARCLEALKAQIVSEGLYFRQQIETGYYSVNVEAYNCDDILLGSGSTEVYVTPGEVTKCSV